MNVNGMLAALDGELDTLKQIRKIVEGLATPITVSSPAKRKTRTAPLAAKAVPLPVAEPVVTVVPPKKKREYNRRPRTADQPLTALGGSISASPVFVPRTAAAPPQPPPPPTAEALEAAMRQKMLGQVA